MDLENLAAALRLLRTTRDLSQSAAGKLDGAPDFRTISHWETKRKQPSLRLLAGYLGALGLDFHDLQDALDAANSVPGITATQTHDLAVEVDRLAQVCEDLAERRQVVLERRSLKAEARAAARDVEIARLAKRVKAIERHLEL